MWVLMGGVWMRRVLKEKVMEDVLNNEKESLMEERKVMEKEYWVNVGRGLY